MFSLSRTLQMQLYYLALSEIIQQQLDKQNFTISNFTEPTT